MFISFKEQNITQKLTLLFSVQSIWCSVICIHIVHKYNPQTLNYDGQIFQFNLHFTVNVGKVI